MKNGFLTGVLLAAVVSAVSAEVTTSLVSNESKSSDSNAVLEPQDSSNLDASVEKLLAETADLKKRVSTLELAPVGPTATEREAVEDDELDARIEELLAWADSMKEGAPVKKANLKVDVEDALQAIRQEELAKKQQRQQERYDEYQEERLAKISQELGLNSVQEQGLRNLWQDRDQRVVQMKNDWEAGTLGMREAGEVKTSIRDDYQAGLQELLTPSQLESMREMEGEDK